MSNAKSTLAFLLQLLARASASLADALATADATIALMGDLGLAVDTAPQSLTNLQAPLNTLAAKETALEAALAANADDSSAVLNAVADLAAASVPFFQAVLALPAALKAEFANDAARLAAIDSTFGRRLFDTLVITFAANSYPAISTILTLLGIIETSFVAGDDPESGNPVIIPSHVVRTIHFDRIKVLVQAPQNVMQTVYGWGTPQFAFTDLLRAVQYLCTSVGLRAGLYGPDAASAAALGTSAGNELRAALLAAALDAGNVELGIAVAEAPSTTAAGMDRGILLRPYLTGTAGAQVPLTDTVTLDLSGDFTASTGIALALRPPPGGFQILTGFLGGGAGSGAAAHITLTLTVAPASRIPIVSQANLFTLDAAGLGFSVKFDAGATSGVGIGVSLTGGKFALQTGQADGFLQQVLPAGGLTVPFEIGLGWSTTGGLTFSGVGALTITLPLHVTILDIITLDSIALAGGAKQGTSGLFVSARLEGGLDIGPVSASVQGLGAEVDLTFPSAGGNLGPASASLTFLPPTGLGLLIDAGPIVGGGFIAYDDVKKEYSAVIQLLLINFQIAAIAILDTILPDGSKGYSFVLILTLQSDEGIPLGFGFTLNGVGGLAGLNRTMVLDAIQASVRSHSLDAILFPTDPVAHAPQIISEITTIFPPSVGVYVFGPMLKIGWGDPTLISVSLGLILELPAPLRIALLGIIAVTLPEPELPVVELHMDVDGTLDFGLKILAIDATIYNSRLVQYSLSGDMAFRFSWADKLIWTLAIGGFNSQFQPPPNFPSLKRVIVSVGVGDNPSLSLNAYLARTSNTVQLGADFELRLSAAGLNIHGYLTFDVLVHFPGFSFVADMTAGVDIKYKGISLANIALALELQGTPPWIYSGSATFHVLFCNVSKHVHGQLGDGSGGGATVSQAVMDLLMQDLGRKANWSADLPQDTEPLVSFLKPAVGDSAILVHPMGQLRIHQKTVPLKTPISKFGDAVPTDGDYFSISQLMIGTVDSTGSIKDATDLFAMGQFQDMTDAQLLSAPSYQSAPAGLTVGADGAQAGNGTDLDATYDTVIIEDPVLPSYSGGRYSLSNSLSNALANQSGFSPSWARGNNKFVTAGTTSPISNTQIGYVVTSTDDLSVRYDITNGTTTTQYMASAQLQAYLQNNPQEVGTLQVMPIHEVLA